MATLGKIAARDAGDTEESNLSFAGCGFNGVYQIGAALHLPPQTQDRGQQCGGHVRPGPAL